ncbi:MAG: hypothetical protein E6J87_04650 [Deltaproteobacteria bacterium]|nr:MAG: hypothetical protein E6J87_04650 [Deltaproteobacteria bacterium]
MFKVCAQCGQEYQSWATECSDCRVPLDLAPGEVLAPETRPVPALEDLVLLRVGDAWELQALAEALQHRGVPSQIDTHPLGARISADPRATRRDPVRLGIYVGRDELDIARDVAAEHVASQLPDTGAGESFSDPNVCPACGEPTPDNASACAACGLEFPEVPSEGAS